MNSSFAIFSESLDKNAHTVKNLFQYCERFGDTILITDSLDSGEFQHFPIFPSFYLRFFQGSIVFIDIEDFLEYNGNTIGKCVLFIDPSKPYRVDRSLLSSNQIFSISEG